MKKRTIAALLAGMACAAGLTACGSLTGTGDAHHIAVIIKHSGEHFQNVMAGAEAYADEHPNVTIDIQFPSTADDSADAVIVSPMQSEQVAAAAENADKPIIALDTDFTSDKKIAFVGTGNEAAALAGGRAAMKQAKANGASQPTAVILVGPEGDATHEARLHGYRSAVEQSGGTVLEVEYCGTQADRASAAMQAIMKKYPQGVDVVLAAGDEIALAAVKSILDDTSSTAYKNTVICGFDGSRAAIEALDRGELTVDIAQQGYDMGYRAVEAAVDTLEGRSVQPVIDSGSEVITADNIDAYIADLKDKGLWE